MTAQKFTWLLIDGRTIFSTDNGYEEKVCVMRPSFYRKRKQLIITGEHFVNVWNVTFRRSNVNYIEFINKRNFWKLKRDLKIGRLRRRMVLQTFQWTQGREQDLQSYELSSKMSQKFETSATLCQLYLCVLRSVQSTTLRTGSGRSDESILTVSVVGVS